MRKSLTMCPENAPGILSNARQAIQGCTFSSIRYLHKLPIYSDNMLFGKLRA